jgi:ABC-2 type transport system permease protein
MRSVWLIAVHGFIQHVTSRPFLLGVMLPMFYLLFVGWVPNASQSQLALLGGTVRHFAVLDETGQAVSAIDAALELDRQSRGFYALSEYAKDHADEDRLRKARPDLARLLIDGDPDSPAQLAEITAMGGSIAAFIELRPYLQKGAPPFTEPAGRFFRINLPPELPTAKDFATAAKPYLSAEKLVTGTFGPVQLWAILVVPKGFLEGKDHAIYYTDDLGRTGLREFLRVALDRQVKLARGDALSLPAPAVDQVLAASGAIESIDPDPEHLGAVTGLRQLQVLGANIVYFMLFFALFMTANMVVMALVEEKSNRVAELLLSCVRAETLMAGKLFTGLMLALFLVTVWVTTVLVSVGFVLPAAQVVVNQLTGNITGVGQIIQIAVFFALSYLTVGAFFLAAGSAANSISDAQAVVAPATLLTMPISMLPLAVAYAPDSLFARIFSYVPFFSPFTMMIRSLSSPQGIDVLGSLVVSLLTLWWLIRLVARVFRANLLRPDSPASFTGFMRDLWGAPRRI